MRVKCKYCQSKGTISHRKEISAEYTELSVNCSNHKCGARTVLDLSYNRTIAPPSNDLYAMLSTMINGMPVEEREKIKQLLPQ